MGSRQQELLDFISQYVETNGFSPTYREMKSHCQYSSLSLVKTDLDSLKEEGQIVISEGKARTVRPNTDRSNI